LVKEKEPEVRFEKALGELKGIVDRLERGDLELDESLKLFERGVRLIQVCSKKLEDAQRRVDIVTKAKDGKKTVRPFAEEGGEDLLPGAGADAEETSTEEEKET
jgi:exodeoxyribonuclease VII small subunit